MSHQTSGTILNSLFEIFNPDDAEYAGVREHFSTQELAHIDAIRALPEDHEFSFEEKVFCSYVIDKAIFTGK